MQAVAKGARIRLSDPDRLEQKMAEVVQQAVKLNLHGVAEE